MTKKQRLMRSFLEAIREKSAFKIIILKTPTGVETKTIPYKLFDWDAKYYNSIFDDDLIHKKDKKVQVIGFADCSSYNLLY